MWKILSNMGVLETWQSWRKTGIDHSIAQSRWSILSTAERFIRTYSIGSSLYEVLVWSNWVLQVFADLFPRYVNDMVCKFSTSWPKRKFAQDIFCKIKIYLWRKSFRIYSISWNALIFSNISSSRKKHFEWNNDPSLNWNWAKMTGYCWWLGISTRD